MNEKIQENTQCKRKLVMKEKFHKYVNQDPEMKERIHKNIGNNMIQKVRLHMKQAGAKIGT